MKKIILATCGYYDIKNTIANGQTIRTISVTRALVNSLGYDHIITLSYHNWKRNPFKVLFRFVYLMICSKNIVLFPDQNAYKFFIPLSSVLKYFTNTHTYYVVIGGWLPSDLAVHKFLIPFIKKTDALFVQTSTLQKSFFNLNINNVFIFPNFKYTNYFTFDDVVSKVYEPPYKLCFFARIERKKGVTELVNAIRDINAFGVKYFLDLYGGIDPSYLEEFNSMINSVDSKYINYRGQVAADDVSSIMSNYFLHVLPTKYKTEGFPGSILDALYSGVPTLASKWNSVNDVLTDGYDSILFDFNDFSDMKNKLVYIYNHPDYVISMKKNCIVHASQFIPSKVIQIMLDSLYL